MGCLPARLWLVEVREGGEATIEGGCAFSCARFVARRLMPQRLPRLPLERKRVRADVLAPRSLTPPLV